MIFYCQNNNLIINKINTKITNINIINSKESCINQKKSNKNFLNDNKFKINPIKIKSNTHNFYDLYEQSINKFGIKFFEKHKIPKDISLKYSNSKINNNKKSKINTLSKLRPKCLDAIKMDSYSKTANVSLNGKSITNKDNKDTTDKKIGLSLNKITGHHKFSSQAVIKTNLIDEKIMNSKASMSKIVKKKQFEENFPKKTEGDQNFIKDKNKCPILKKPIIEENIINLNLIKKKAKKIFNHKNFSNKVKALYGVIYSQTNTIKNANDIK